MSHKVAVLQSKPDAHPDGLPVNSTSIGETNIHQENVPESMRRAGFYGHDHISSNDTEPLGKK